MTVQTIYDWLNALAPFDSAEDFDNVGLLIGDMNAEVHTVLFGLDATPELAYEACAIGAELIITHHPLIFHPLSRIDYISPQGQAIQALMRGRLHVIAAHTNWDKASGGVSDALTSALSLRDARSIDDYSRLGYLPKAMNREELTAFITERLHVIPRVYGRDQSISCIAAAGGAYGEGAAQALCAGAQAYITGEIRHHELLDACARGLTVYEAGHYATEAPGIQALYERFLADAAAAQWPVNARLYDIVPYRGALL